MKTAEIISDFSTYVIHLRDRTGAFPVRFCHGETRGDPGAFYVRVARTGHPALGVCSAAHKLSRGHGAQLQAVMASLMPSGLGNASWGQRALLSRAPAGFGGPTPSEVQGSSPNQKALSSLRPQDEFATHAQDRPFPPTLLTTVRQAEGEGKSDLRPCLCLPRICLKYESHKAMSDGHF